MLNSRNIIMLRTVGGRIILGNDAESRYQWPRGLRRRSAAARLLRLWVRISPGAWMFFCCECCVLLVKGLCDGLITRPEESYWLWCVVVCDLETSSRMRRPWTALGCSAMGRARPWKFVRLCIVGVRWMKYDYGALVELHSLESPICLEKTMFQRHFFLHLTLSGPGSNPIFRGDQLPKKIPVGQTVRGFLTIAYSSLALQCHSGSVPREFDVRGWKITSTLIIQSNQIKPWN